MRSDSEFYRIQRLPPYVFETVNQLKAKLRTEGADIIDFGFGNPDMETPKHIIDKLVETARKPRTNRYSSSKGIPGLRASYGRYYKRRFDVELDPETEIIATLGSKEGFANLAQAISAPGDVILAPNPSYPIHPFGFIIAGGTVRHIKALNPEQYLQSIDAIAQNAIPKPLAVITCFPANPTAETCDLNFYREVVKLARKHEMYVLSDLAYSEIYFEDPPPSILQVDGAKDICVELSTLSKTYAMAGWRMGFAVGSPKLIGALTRMKSYLDYGAYTPIQVAACAALDGPQDCVDEIRQTYKTRRDVLVDTFGRAGWEIPLPKASMFAWAPLPPGFTEMGSLAFAETLMREAHIAVAPGVGFGEYGEGFVRIALVENEQRIRQAARNIGQFLAARS
ncbi:MAG: LL-diaminopimelate aminotransferase [Robiginitomaculum sp.]|nr:LL-diaminopimelate aminotransferase [Robiginitomaculum sp.]